MGPRSLLWALEPLLKRNKGADHEANIFAVLYPSARIIRAFEFAAVDGAVDCTEPQGTISPPHSYAERFWRAREWFTRYKRDKEHVKELVLFDVKSSSEQDPSAQIYLTSIEQSKSAAFYICVSGSDPTFVELIPNTHMPPAPPLGKNASNTYFQLNTTRTPQTSPSQNGPLNLWGSPYRMPLALLSDAVARIVDCAHGHGDYANPWTGQSFPGWRPAKVTSFAPFLEPHSTSQHYNAFLGVMDMYRAILSNPQADLVFDFVHLAPRLADFKIVKNNRQFLVQYKKDGRTDRSAITNNLRASIGRTGTGDEIRYYFTPFERFDFLLYEFEYKSTIAAVPYLFFIPECRIPEEFYTTQDKEADFGRFQAYGMFMDAEGRWVEQIARIIEQHPAPRLESSRRMRANGFTSYLSKKVNERLAELLAIQAPLRTTPSPPLAALSSRRTPETFQKRLYNGLMKQCALRRSGLVVALPPMGPSGDFALLSYRWTEVEYDNFQRSTIPPKFLSQLPSMTPIVCLYAYAKQAPTTSHGPALSSSQLRRLNSRESSHRLLLFDPLLPETLDLQGPLYVVPTADVSLTAEQIQIYTSNLETDKRAKNPERSIRVPYLSGMLHTRCAIADYLVAARGPLLYQRSHDDAWSELWGLLHRFLDVNSFSYPATMLREPREYRTTIQALNERLVTEVGSMPQEVVSQGAQVELFDMNDDVSKGNDA